MPCCGRRNLTPQQQAEYDRAMIDAYSIRRRFGAASPEAQSAIAQTKETVVSILKQEKESRTAKKAKEVLKGIKGIR